MLTKLGGGGYRPWQSGWDDWPSLRCEGQPMVSALSIRAYPPSPPLCEARPMGVSLPILGAVKLITYTDFSSPPSTPNTSI